MVWDAVHGERTHEERFMSVVTKADGGVLVLGKVYQSKKTRPHLIIAEFDKRGRTDWEKIHKIPYVHDVVKIAPDGDGYVALVNLAPPQERKKVWLGFFDGLGNIKSHKILKSKKHDLTAKDMQPKIDDAGWVISLTSSVMLDKKEGIEQKSASVIMIDRDGKEEASRSYILGKKTEISSLSVSKSGGEDGGYIATGWFENNNGKKIGWVLRLDPDLSIGWQKEFSRGVSANVVTSVISQSGAVYVGADVQATDSQVDGVWAASLDWGSGDILWQRYYMSDEGIHDYTIRDVDVNKDGLISLLMMARANRDAIKEAGDDVVNKMSGFGVHGDSNYAHLLTLTPRGIAIGGDAFYKGKDAFISQMLHNPMGQRVMVGTALIEPDLSLDGEVEETGVIPLNEAGEITLPDVELSDKTKQGLALLQKRINAQDLVQDDDHHADEEHDKESAESEKHDDGYVRKGWVVIGDMSDPYEDPCK